MMRRQGKESLSHEAVALQPGAAPFALRQAEAGTPVPEVRRMLV